MEPKLFQLKTRMHIELPGVDLPMGTTLLVGELPSGVTQDAVVMAINRGKCGMERVVLEEGEMPAYASEATAEFERVLAAKDAVIHALNERLNRLGPPSVPDGAGANEVA